MADCECWLPRKLLLSSESTFVLRRVGVDTVCVALEVSVVTAAGFCCSGGVPSYSTPSMLVLAANTISSSGVLSNGGSGEIVR